MTHRPKRRGGNEHCMQRTRVRAVAAPVGRGGDSAKNNSRFPAGMTTRNGTATETAEAPAPVRAAYAFLLTTDDPEADSLRE